MQKDPQTKPLYAITDTGDSVIFAYKTKTVQSGYHDEDHTYDRPKMVHITSGTGVWEIGGKKTAVTKDDVLVFGSGDVRHLDRITSAVPFCFEQVEFMPVALYPWQATADFFFRPERQKTGLCPRDNIHYPRLLAGFAAIREEIAVSTRDKDAYLIHLLTGMVISAARLMDPAGGAVSRDTPYGIVCDAIRAIHEETDAALSRETLAAKYHVSPSHFSRMFKEYSGSTFRAYLMRSRVRTAVQLLENTDRAVLDIALSCGFAGTSGFYKAFRAVTGKTPLQVRKTPHTL